MRRSEVEALLGRKEQDTRAIAADALITAGKLFDVHPRDLAGNYRYGFVTRARFAIYLALRDALGWSISMTGAAMGKEHSGVRYGLTRAEEFYKREANYAIKVDKIIAHLRKYHT